MSNNFVDALIIPSIASTIAISCFVLFIAFPG